MLIADLAPAFGRPVAVTIRVPYAPLILANDTPGESLGSSRVSY